MFMIQYNVNVFIVYVRTRLCQLFQLSTILLLRVRKLLYTNDTLIACGDTFELALVVLLL